MIWRAWTFLSGTPIGALAVLAMRSEPTPRALAWGALGGGIVLLAGTEWIARARAPGGVPGRGLAAAASVGWLAAPALGALLLGLAPGARALLAGVLALLAAAMLRAHRRPHPGPGPVAWIARAGSLVLAGAFALVAVTALRAGTAGTGAAPVPEERTRLVYDLDTRIATRPLPACTGQVRRVEPLLDRGAHPRLGPAGAVLWFDAPVAGGVRQVHRLERATGRVTCWTCEESGHNVRPAPGDSGAVFAFVTDRYTSWRRPWDTEIQLGFAAGERPGRASQRLTHWPGADDHPVLGPTSRFLVWSRGVEGRYAVVAASLFAGHGGVTLGNPSVLVPGGTAWIAPLAWSPDARSLVVARGNPFGSLRGSALDPATGEESPLGNDLAGGASFNADGGWLALTTGRSRTLAGALPAGAGFLLAPLAAQRETERSALAPGGVRTGPPRPGPGQQVELAELSDWGASTGLALEPDGTAFVLGQRRRTDGRSEERLVRVVLDCAPPPATERS